MTKATARNRQTSSQVTDLAARKRIMSNASANPDDAVSDERLDSEYGYYFELSSAKDLKDFKRRIDNIVKRLGFGDYGFVRLANVEESRELISIQDDLITAYDRGGLYEYDLVLLHAIEHTRPIFRSTVNEHVLEAPFTYGEHTRCMREAYKLNKSFGYYDFYNVPIKASNGNGNVVLSVTRRGLSPTQLKRQVQQCVTDLQLLCEAIDFVSISKHADKLLEPDDEEGRVIKINPRPLMVLDMLANSDLNITEVAAKMGINVVTANRHLQAARKAFGVKTNHAAIKQGIQNKLIQYK
ncbi:MAG: autoinducer binding domain-containing protein [Pseudomonadota bacterium]